MMPKEKDDYREILADILEFTNGKRLLSIRDVARYLSITPDTAAKRYGVTKNGIMAQSLARKLCQ